MSYLLLEYWFLLLLFLHISGNSKIEVVSQSLRGSKEQVLSKDYITLGLGWEIRIVDVSLLSL